VSGLAPIPPLGAVQFLTRIPVRLRAAPDLAACVPWFPVVGAVIGAVIGAVVVGLMELVPAGVAAAVGIVFGLVLTGAFHEDGLADTADALGGWSPEQRREILKDSRHGSYGVAAMCSTILLRVLCVASLGPATAFAALVAAHSLGRGASVAVMVTTPPAPTTGLGADYTRELRAVAAGSGVAASLVVAVLATGWWAAPLAAAAGVGALGVALLARRAFGGVSGDLLGAVEQVGEILVLVVATALAARHPLWWT
jgi:adenosylcobinamide-GDP ribazoletransferase